VRLAFTITLLGALAAGGCAYPPPAVTEMEAERALEEGPETEEDRVATVLGELEDYCQRNSAACAAAELPRIYPNVQVPEDQRRFVNDRYKYLRSVGIEVRWDPGTNRFAVLRGNSPSYRGDLRDDP
jgi:hypothetical protein